MYCGCGALLTNTLCRDHAEQACYFISKDPRYASKTFPFNDVLSAALDWLCLNVPESMLGRNRHTMSYDFVPQWYHR